ncbi:MAG: 30S ribosomal protein S9 [Candidatus Paceibacterota bacterium]|jgi:small subunit ribosomal protein S9
MEVKEKTAQYIEAVGRRKTAIARVRITPNAKASLSVNEKEVSIYFPVKEQQMIISDAFVKSGIAQKFKTTIMVNGGGINSQAEAIRLGIARALIVYDKELRGVLKKAGYLKRDPRAKERRKFGLKKARKAPQWSKR